MKHLLLTTLMALPVLATAQDYTDVTFTPGTRYSQLLIDSRITDFYANKKLMGLNAYDATGSLVKANAGAQNLKFDYVPGLVAKAIIEAASYYRNEDFSRAWFKSVENYANRCIDEVPVTGGSLDDLNATKMYTTLYDLAKTDGPFASIAEPQTVPNAAMAMQRAMTGLTDTRDTYSIRMEVDSEAEGGWYHKKSYPNQMWCDGQYMGPALMAQLLDYGYQMAGRQTDWEMVMRQFDITWSRLWDADKKLLWHAFSSDPKGEKAASWANPETGRSQEYWGRACGWYFLALVDVLEFIPADIEYAPALANLSGYSSNCRTRIQQYLEKLADGLAARQDAATGCWYQLLAHDGTFYADSYNGNTFPKTYNYLESSCSAIFVAAYLKGIRLGVLSRETYGPMAERGYQGFVSRFVKQLPDGTYTLIDCCASAGLGGASWGARDGSAAYYLLGNDVTRVTTYTEGKVYGAFILASVEYERTH